MLKLRRSRIHHLLQNPFSQESKSVAETILRCEEITFHPSHRTTYRFLDIYQIGNKVAIEKERARLKDEMNRGYFADISELKKHGGKVSVANKIMIPAMAAVKFPDLEVNLSNGTSIKLPNGTNQDNKGGSSKAISPGPSLVCLSFRASSQKMIESWSVPVSDAFRTSKVFRLYEVSLIDSWFLSLKPIKQLLLRVMRKSKTGESNALERQIVYAFGDHYYFRKSLNILNLLTGYIFLLDGFGRIRWQGSGFATKEELTSLLSCTSLLVEENEMAASKPQ
ncbi:hypothetical protein Syun_000625 [Stephania yunnanensis]|uniref:Uncharacterized protein n=1 Tax=Stephania yunnanensis TaxID=152371 RepID=A0AAP0LDD1_9MAGN